MVELKNGSDIVWGVDIREKFCERCNIPFILLEDNNKNLYSECPKCGNRMGRLVVTMVSIDSPKPLTWMCDVVYIYN